MGTSFPALALVTRRVVGHHLRHAHTRRTNCEGHKTTGTERGVRAGIKSSLAGRWDKARAADRIICEETRLAVPSLQRWICCRLSLSERRRLTLDVVRRPR